MKYFYTDPRKALWMLQEFQMQFFCIVFEVGVPAPLEENELRGMIYHSLNARIYIKNDCHELLKPRVCDVIRYYNDHIRSDDYTIIYNGCISLYKERLEEIIQRNRKAFFMPEMEE